MAFIRKETKKSGTYLRFVESYRDAEGKSKHRTLYNLGRAEDYSPESLKRMGQVLYELGGGKVEEIENKQLKEIGRYNYGFPLVVRKLFKEYALDGFLQRRINTKGLGFNLADSVSLLICERLHDPVSKRSNFINQSDYLGLDRIELHQIYRTLDQLYESQESLKHMIYQEGRNLFNQELDVVFYDVTTFYFDSDKEDGFREKGFGKDGKIGKTIVVFGMLIDQNKQPVGYEVYHGKQYEGYTFSDAIKRLKQKYQIGKVICVADSGMMNQENTTEIQNEEYEYIFGERLKNISHAKQNEILDLKKYKTTTVTDDQSNEQIEIKYYMMYHWTKKRILGHLALCYICFTLLNYLQLRLKQSKTPLSENQIRKALSKMQVSLIKQDKREYYLSSKAPVEAEYILKALRLRGLPHMMPKEAIGNYT